MGEEPGLHNCFNLSGWIKILESVLIFVCLMLHRIGDGGKQVKIKQRKNKIKYINDDNINIINI